MENFAIVRPEHLNHHGYLFGGALLKWVDEFAWMAASRDYRGCTLVTIGMDEIVFRNRVGNGAILRFVIDRIRRGTTSVTYRVDVHSDEPGAVAERPVFTTTVTFVRVDSTGAKCPLPDDPDPSTTS